MPKEHILKLQGTMSCWLCALIFNFQGQGVHFPLDRSLCKPKNQFWNGGEEINSISVLASNPICTIHCQSSKWLRYPTQSSLSLLRWWWWQWWCWWWHDEVLTPFFSVSGKLIICNGINRQWRFCWEHNPDAWPLTVGSSQVDFKIELIKDKTEVY